jgi:ankyrin repeat protein
MLVEAGAELDVLEASALGQTDRVRQLLKSDPSLVQALSHDGWSPLHLAAYFGHERVVAALVASAADINRKSCNHLGHTPLHAAVSGQQLAIVQFLIKHGAEVDARDSGGSTALHLAAHEGFNDILLNLLETGASVNPARKDGATPLMTALLQGQKGAAQLLRWKRAQLWA